MAPSARIPTAVVKIFEDQGQLTIEIAPRRSWTMAKTVAREVSLAALLTAARELLLTALLIALAIPFAAQLSKGPSWPNLAIAAGFVVFLSVLVCKSILRLIWHAFGQEDIVLRAGTLSVVRRLGYLAWSRVYTVDKLRDLHTVFQPSALWAWHIYRVVRGSLGFNYQGSACHFGDRLNDEQAKELLKKFRHWLPESSWTPVLGLNK